MKKTAPETRCYWLALACACFVAVLYGMMSMGWTDALDRQVLSFLRSDTPMITPGEKMYALDIMRDITSLAGLGLVVLVLVVTVVYLLLRRLWREAIVAVVLVAATQATVTILKLLIARPRPDLVDHGAQVATHSFPSGHASMGAALSLMIAWTVATRHKPRRIKVFAWIVGGIVMVLIGLSRAYLGVHWTSDVLAGWSVGAAWACVCIGLAHTLAGRYKKIDHMMGQSPADHLAEA